MYHYLDDKKFLRQMRAFGGKIMQRLCHDLKEDYDIGAICYLVGSGAKNLVMQNGNAPVDLDYNLEIRRCEDIMDGRHLKECVQKAFNKVLKEFDLPDCNDSTVPLTSEQMWFKSGNKTKFHIDVCITMRDHQGNYHRLIHKKTGWVSNDRYYWNMAPQSNGLKEKAEYIKACKRWELVREQYCEIKNRYLSRNESEHHPSFICYTEAVNNVYNQLHRSGVQLISLI